MNDGRLRQLGLSSVLIVPLTARGHTLGAISLARSGGAPPYGEADLATAERPGPPPDVIFSTLPVPTAEVQAHQ